MKDTMIIESLNGDMTVDVLTRQKNYYVATFRTPRGDVYEMSLGGEYETCYHYAMSREDRCIAFRGMVMTLVREI